MTIDRRLSLTAVRLPATQASHQLRLGAQKTLQANPNREVCSLQLACNAIPFDYALLATRSNGTSSHQGSSSAASAGIIGGYEGNSQSLRIIIAFLLGLSLYNAVETTLLIFATFQRFSGIYFYSLLVATLGILPYSTGFILKFFSVTPATEDSHWLPVTLITIGWYAMVTGQSVVLWSRLHLIMIGRHADKILNWTKWMIIVNVFVLHVPTTTLTYGCNGAIAVDGFVRVFNVYEKIQMVGFCLQELLLSSIYIYYTLLILRSTQSIAEATQSKATVSARTVLYQLFIINVIIIALDVVLLGFEFANLYILEASFKGVVYSLKTKLEFAVLGKLVQLVKRERTLSAATIDQGRQFSVAFDTKSRDESPGTASKTNGHTNKSMAHELSTIPSNHHHDQTNSNSSSTITSTHSHANSPSQKGFASSQIQSHWHESNDRPAHNPSSTPLPPRTILPHHDTIEQTLEEMKSARRMRTADSAKGSQDAIFEHYESLLDRDDSLLEREEREESESVVDTRSSHEQVRDKAENV